MPSSQRPKYDWPIRMSFVVYGRKPSPKRLPGMDTPVGGRYNGRYVWRFCLNELYAN